MTDERLTKAQLAAMIPGVRLGPGVPIEAATEARAARLRIKSREEKSDLIVIDVSKYKDYHEEAMPLASGELQRASWVPRYHPVTGITYITRYDTPLTATDTGKQRLVADHGERYKILRKPTYAKEIDLNAFPVAWTVARRVPQRLQTIESALRQQDEVAHDYYIGGPEFARVEEVGSAIRALSIQFIQDHPTLDEDFQELRVQLTEVFARHGFASVASPIWQRVQDKVMRAIQKDSLGRPNPSASRFILGSAILGTVTREVVTGLTREKSTKIYSHLLGEREVERSTLAWASDELERIRAEIEKSVDIDPTRFNDTRIRYFSGEIRMVDAILSEARVSPYLEVASLARDFVASETFRKWFENKRITARLEAHNWATVFESYEGVTAEEYVMRRDANSAIRVLKESSGMLDACLADPQHLDINVFEH